MPYVNTLTTGSISGIIGAGGNVGAVVFGLFFREFDPKRAFILMGSAIICSAMLSLFINIQGHVKYFLRPSDIVKQSEFLVSPSKGTVAGSDTSSPRSQKLEEL